MVEDRIAALESRADTLEERLRKLEGPTRVVAPSYPPPIAPRPRAISAASATRG